ncbi:hypothetical protein V6N12_002346 [Hibiscus sabdariffa]|uniref:Uncharacterized protein n=1 Tax=Hibiscus sabdariffa TaxID=183260 RepID=A0ABR1ZX73_9ROSI
MGYTHNLGSPDELLSRSVDRELGTVVETRFYDGDFGPRTTIYAPKSPKDLPFASDGYKVEELWWKEIWNGSRELQQRCSPIKIKNIEVEGGWCTIGRSVLAGG